MNKIDYVIISSDDNPMYKDFYQIVAKRWFELGIRTYYINITSEDSLEASEFGFIHKIKAIDSLPTSFQAQIVRLYASKFIEGNLLMSDIDMLPINSDYYNQYNSELKSDNVIIYSGQPYGTTPYYPMCYVLSHSSNFIKYLEIGEIGFSEYCIMLHSKYGQAWNTDENFMYDKFQKHLDKLVIKDRDFSRRVDRGNWVYNIDGLQSGYYIDSHMLRPYSTYKKNIDELINYVE